MLWFVIEQIRNDLTNQSVIIYSDNLPSVSWVEQMASRKSVIGAHMIRAIALRMNLQKRCPIMPQHVTGKQNLMADYASSWLFGHPAQWCFNSGTEFAQMFN